MTLPRQGLGVWLLALGQTLGYACIFYIFAALILSLEADLGWDKRVFALGPMLAIGVAAVTAPIAGRLVDRGFGRALLIGGAGLGGAALLALSRIESSTGYLAIWAVVGLAQTACLYEVAFAYLVRRYGDAARPRIIRVTLVAGLASTLAFPSGAVLSEAIGWRGAMVVAGAVMLLVTLPLHLFACRLIRAETEVEVADTGGPSTSMRQALGKPVFWAMASLFALVNLNHWMLISFLVPLLVAQSVPHGVAVLAASLVGPSQTLGRFALMRAEARIGTVRATGWTMIGLAVAPLFLLMAGVAPLMVFGFAAVQGGAMGVMTILRPVLVADAMGRAEFGGISGMLSIASLGASALAPVVAAALFQSAGPFGLIVASLTLAGAALVLARIMMVRTL